MNDGHDQTLVAKRRADADIDIGKQFQAFIVETAVDFGHGAQRRDRGFDEIGGIGQFYAPAFQAAAGFRPVRNNRRHIGLEHTGDMGCGLHAFHHVRGDALAHHRMRHDGSFCKRRESILILGDDRFTTCDMPFYIFASHAAVTATTRDLRGIQAVLCEQFFDSRA